MGIVGAEGRGLPARHPQCQLVPWGRLAGPEPCLSQPGGCSQPRRSAPPCSPYLRPPSTVRPQVWGPAPTRLDLAVRSLIRARGSWRPHPLVTQPFFPECEWFCDITAGLSVGEAFSAGSESRHSGQGRREARPSALAAHRDTAAGAGGLEAHG